MYLEACAGSRASINLDKAEQSEVLCGCLLGFGYACTKRFLDYWDRTATALGIFTYPATCTRCIVPLISVYGYLAYIRMWYNDFGLLQQSILNAIG